MLKCRLDGSASAPKCNAKFGRLPDDTAERVRDILSNDIQKTIAAIDKIQIKNMSRDGRKSADLKEGQVQEDAEISQEVDESILTLGMLPITPGEEEDDEDSLTAILDSVLEEEAVDDDEKYIEEDNGEDEVSAINEHAGELEFEGASGHLFVGDVDDLENFTEYFDAYPPEKLLDTEFDE